MIDAKVLSVSKSSSHTFNKYNTDSINLIEDLGVEGDAHSGKTVKHRSRVAKDPSQPNLRQVHLIHTELFEELSEKGFKVAPGQMGENITTKGIDLLSIPTNTILFIGQHAKIKITGLRNPCHQINSIQEGLMNAVIDKDEDGNLIRKSGVMGVVLNGGKISPNDKINISFPHKPYIPLVKV